MGHILAGHPVGEGRFSGGAPLQRGFGGRDLDGRLDLANEGGKVFASGCLGDGCAGAEKVDGCFHCAAGAVAHDDDQFCPCTTAGVLDAAEDFVFGDVASDANAENVAKAEVEDELAGGPGVDATEDDGHRKLPRGGCVDLAAEIAGEAFT